MLTILKKCATILSVMASRKQPKKKTAEPSVEELDQERRHLDMEMAQLHKFMAERLMRRAQLDERIGAVAMSDEDTLVTEDEVSLRTEIAARTAEIHRKHEWINAQYAWVASSWQRHGIEVPPQEELEQRLHRAHRVASRMVEEDEHLDGRLNVVLVPPKAVMDWPVKESLRESQGLVAGHNIIGKHFGNRYTGKRTSVADKIHGSIAPTTSSDEWRVLVTDTSESGRYYGSPKNIVQHERYMIAGYDTREMGPTEYAALSLQSTELLEKQSWTWLLKDYTPGNGAPRPAQYATSHSTTYDTFVMQPTGQNFEFKSANENFNWGGARFRPTVEILAD